MPRVLKKFNSRLCLSGLLDYPGGRSRCISHRSVNASRKRHLLVLSIFALLASAKAVAAGDSPEEIAQRKGSGNAIAGKALSENERCQECHGADGNSGDARIPKHAGQYADYLIKQLRNFQSGERKYQIMNVMVEDLTETDIADIAAYFASQKQMQGIPKGDYPAASSLFVEGDKNRNIQACSSCHGQNGKGRSADNTVFPVIGGQHEIYLRAQLIKWKLGERTNSADGVMNKIAKSLTDQEIEELANYISGL